MKSLKVAIAGNPNVGKTSILNHIAGSRLKVGNWPGVTVEKKEAEVIYKNYRIHFVDLPGIYTLEPITEDERIAVNFLENERPDVILNIIDTPNLERSLILTAELLEFEIPTVIVLNMIDEAERLGLQVDDKRIEELLNVKVVKTVGRTGKGVKEILPAIVEVYEKNLKPKVPVYSEEIEELLKNFQGKNKHEKIKKLLEERPQLYKKISDERYAFAHGLTAEVLRRKEISARDITDILDRFVLHPVLGFVIFILAVYITFKVAFDFSTPFVDWIDSFINDFLAPTSYTFLNALGFPEWFLRFFSEAVIGGVGFVLTFVPLIASLYFFITLLEMSGYIPRVAFLMDRFMHRLGLHGKSVIPLLLGFGCNVPAIVATRTMESTRDKLIVVMMIPFMSCPARLVVFAFFVSVFFPENPALVITAMYLLGILVAIFTAFILRKTFYKTTLTHFVMELPPYRLPSFKVLFLIVWAHVKDFLYRAGTLIFASSILIWFLLNLPPGVKNPQESVAGHIGRALVYVFEPVGIDNWKATTSLIPAFLAREIVLSSMGTIYTASEGLHEEEEKDFNFSESLKEQIISFGEALKNAFVSLFSPKIVSLEVEEEEEGLKELIRKDFTPASALSFMTFLLIYTSCLGTFGVMIREIGKKRAVLFLLYSFIVAWSVSFIVYRVSSFIIL